MRKEINVCGPDSAGFYPLPTLLLLFSLVKRKNKNPKSLKVFIDLTMVHLTLQVQAVSLEPGATCTGGIVVALEPRSLLPLPPSQCLHALLD